MKAGVEAEAALRTLNSALALRGEEEGGFTTVDLLQIDLFTGQSALYKFGAAPTYVRKGDTVSKLSGSALPAGLVWNVERGQIEGTVSVEVMRGREA